MRNKINITLGEEGLINLPEQLLENDYSGLFVLVDINTKTHCLPSFISQTGLDQVKILVMEAGEQNKNLQTCKKLWEKLSDMGADRNSALINLGGGVVTDLGGFVSCTFKRGIDFYNIPTTLLSMVDASVGGKTGIDLGSLKNQIGIIKEPKQVIIDFKWLSSLPQKEIRSGFAEMLKHGLIAKASYWEKLKKLATLDISSLSLYIEPSIIIKNTIVSKDPNEKHLRKILNFGHTLGHAIESYFLAHPKKEQLLHGEAIAIGMVLEGFLGVHCCGFPEGDAHDIKKTFTQYFPQVILNKEDREGILKVLRHDKKNKGGKINFVLLKSIGNPQIDVEVPQELLDQAFDFYSKT